VSFFIFIFCLLTNSVIVEINSNKKKHMYL